MVPTMVVGLALWFMLNRLPIGRFILAVGGNQHAAELSGISICKHSYHRARAFGVPCRARRSTPCCPFTNGPANDRRRLANPIFCRASDWRRRPGRWSRKRTCYSAWGGDCCNNHASLGAIRHRPVPRAGRAGRNDLGSSWRKSFSRSRLSQNLKRL